MDGDKVHRKQLKRVIKFLKKLVNIAVIVFALIEVSDAGGQVDFFQVISATLMIMGFLLSLLLEAMLASLKKKVARLTESVKGKVGSIKEDIGSSFSKAKMGATSIYNKIKNKKSKDVIEVEE